MSFIRAAPGEGRQADAELVLDNGRTADDEIVERRGRQRPIDLERGIHGIRRKRQANDIGQAVWYVSGHHGKGMRRVVCTDFAFQAAAHRVHGQYRAVMSDLPAIDDVVVATHKAAHWHADRLAHDAAELPEVARAELVPAIAAIRPLLGRIGQTGPEEVIETAFRAEIGRSAERIVEIGMRETAMCEEGSIGEEHRLWSLLPEGDQQPRQFDLFAIGGSVTCQHSVKPFAILGGSMVTRNRPSVSSQRKSIS